MPAGRVPQPALTGAAGVGVAVPVSVEFCVTGAVVFSLMVSALIGSVVGVTLIVCGRREWSSRMPYGPYIALAAVIWLFGRGNIVGWLTSR